VGRPRGLPGARSARRWRLPGPPRADRCRGARACWRIRHQESGRVGAFLAASARRSQRADPAGEDLRRIGGPTAAISACTSSSPPRAPILTARGRRAAFLRLTAVSLYCALAGARRRPRRGLAAWPRSPRSSDALRGAAQLAVLSWCAAGQRARAGLLSVFATRLPAVACRSLARREECAAGRTAKRLSPLLAAQLVALSCRRS
jgi:hypothetical protein